MPPQNYSNQNPNDPYGFIMNNPQQPQRSSGPSGMRGRIIVVAIGVVILIILGIIFSSLLSKGSKDQAQRLLEISQRQTEIIRISTQADKKAKSIATKQFALTTRLTTESSQKDINELLAKKGYNEKKLSKVLSASKNSKSDAALADAEKNNRFDETFMLILTGELNNYQKQLNTAASGASKTQKKVLQKSFNSAAVIQKKVEKSAPATTPTTTTEDGSEEDAGVDDVSLE